MPSPFDAVLAAPFGKLGVRVADGSLRELTYLPESTPTVDSSHALIRKLARQLDAYYGNPNAAF
ncbi:hypothetical protein ABTF44_20535, partial [Acinetobacter baumannii]